MEKFLQLFDKFMKWFIIFLFVVLFFKHCSCHLNAQSYLSYVKAHKKEYAISLTSSILSGTSKALHDNCLYHNKEFTEILGMHGKYFAFDSWKNKYKNGDPKQGEAYFMSTSALVWTTDFNHLSETIYKMSTISMTYCLWADKPKIYYIYDLIILFAINSITFNTIYNVTK